jgi:hypothetical protein
LSEQQEQSGAQAEAKAKAQDVKEQAQEKARDIRQEARGRAVEQVDQRSTQAGTEVSTVAADVRSVGEELRRQGKDGPARLADQAADRADRLGSYLQDSDADRILRDVEDFGRRQPWAMVAAGLALGFVASRFLKASSRERYESSHGGDGGPPRSGAVSG